jgi:hypothetical protein
MKKRKMIYLLLLSLFLGTAGVNAQVAINNEAGPHDSAVLDLRLPESAVTQLGLLLPRVVLTNLISPAWDLNGNSAAGGDGRLVYVPIEGNATATLPGIYLWHDSRWNLIVRIKN